MPIVPVICHNCEALYGASVLNGAMLANTRLGNNPIPCPFCGKVGYTVEGLYSSVGQLLKIIVTSAYSKEKLAILAKELEIISSKELDIENLKTKIQQNLPELKGISDIIPKTRSELYAFLAVLLSAITLLLSSITNFSNSSKTITPEVVNKIVTEAINNSMNGGNKQFHERKRSRSRKAMTSCGEKIE